MKAKKPHSERPKLTNEQVSEKLLSRHIQPTAQRIALCRYLLCEADHPTAEEVKNWADKNFPKLSLATVYNTLKILVGGGIIREFKFPHSDRVVYDCNTEQHFHFVDEASGEIFDLGEEQLKVIPQLGKKFQIHGVEVILTGRKV